VYGVSSMVDLGTARRIRALRIQPSLLIHLIAWPRKSEHLTSTGMPDDARFLDAHYDYERRMFLVYVESETFEEVPEGETPPELDVVFTVHYDPGDDWLYGQGEGAVESLATPIGL
jgi:hypothetical protein